MAAISFTEFLHEALPMMEDFLGRFLRTWNGHQYKAQIYCLISTLEPIAYEDLYGSVLHPLLRVFTMGDADTKAEIIATYAKLLRKWMRRAAVHRQPTGHSLHTHIF